METRIPPGPLHTTFGDLHGIAEGLILCYDEHGLVQRPVTHAHAARSVRNGLAIQVSVHPQLAAVNGFVSWREEDGHFDAIDRHLEKPKPAIKH